LPQCAKFTDVTSYTVTVYIHHLTCSTTYSLR